jgi:protein SCO1/2
MASSPPSRWSRARPWLIGLVLAAGAAAAFWLLRPAPAPSGNLEGATVGGPFQLVDENGNTVTDADFAGRWRLMYFGFTHCPDICPTDTAKLAQGLAAFEQANPKRAARVQPLFVTVDPARDTPAALAEFTAQFHPRLIGLTGSQPQVASMLEAFRIYARRIEGSTPDDYLVDHAALFYLFDPEGRPIAFRSGFTATADDLAAMLDRHVR